MSAFTSHDGTEVSFRVLGESTQLLVCLPGGPLRASRYLGNLGGLDANRGLVIVDLPPRRVDRIVADLDALRSRLGCEQIDLLAHSAAGNLAMLYAAAHPDRVERLVLITPGTRSVGIVMSEVEERASLGRRAAEPWYEEATAAMKAWEDGDDSPANRLAAAPFFYGRWDETARRHAACEAEEATPGAPSTYYAAGGLHPERIREDLAGVAAEVLILVGELDLWPTENAGRQLSELFPRATVVVQPGAGHFPWLDNPAAFVAAVTGFLDRAHAR